MSLRLLPEEGPVSPEGASAQISATEGDTPSQGNSLKLIAYCFEGETLRTSIKRALAGYNGTEITVLIGPEGDFSPEEAQLAIQNGYIPIHLGSSRLRTETAAVTAVEAVYLHFMQ